MGGLTRAELLDALEPDGGPHAPDEQAPSREQLFLYVEEDELDGVPPEVAGIVLAAREMGRALAATRHAPAAGGGEP